ncbi:MAG: Fur family transcriptional regulator [Pseudomonadota bacterium]
MSKATLDRIEASCLARGVRFTAQRRRVFLALCEAGGPVGAYDIMQALDEKAVDGAPKTAPPTVYRALEFLQAQGFVHRIASIQAFVACAEPGHKHSGQFLICPDCGRVDELDDERLGRSVGEAAAARGFASNRQIEVTALCDECHAQG